MEESKPIQANKTHSLLSSTAIPASWIAVTLGDPSGIGPEVVLQSFLKAPELLAKALVFGYKAVLLRALKFVDPEERLCLVPMRLQKFQNAQHPERSKADEVNGESSRTWGIVPVSKEALEPASLEGRMPVFIVDLADLSEEAKETFLLTHWSMSDPGLDDLGPLGQINPQSGEIAARAVVAATRACLLGVTQALVTAPLHKESLALANWPYPGHTELLQAECARFFSKTLDQMPVRMMLKNRELAVVLVSIHISIRQAIERVTFDNVLATLQITHKALTRTLGRAPKIALSALNPHAGEGGLMGQEEEEILKPVVSRAKALGLDVQGPFAPDTIYMRARQEGLKSRTALLNGQKDSPKPFDVVVSMYHDQGLIPVKYLGLEQGVNVTLGLPLIRTSPDHGTAFDLAGTGQADPGSFIEAYQEAQKMVLGAVLV
jgi:4-hydroxythreonine-4-phosphate dehydrogenase